MFLGIKIVKNQDKLNNVSNKHAESYLKILHILRYTQKIKKNKDMDLSIVKMHIFRTQILLFLCSLEFKEFSVTIILTSHLCW
jgi:hypothetical protein